MATPVITQGDRTNVTPTGYTFNGTQYKKETRTDAQGNPYTVDIAQPTPQVNPQTTSENTTGTTLNTGTANTGSTTDQTVGGSYGSDTLLPQLDSYGNYLKTQAEQPVDEQTIRNQKLAEIQAEIDAQNRIYADKLRQEKIAGTGRLGESTAIQARRGLLGSDFGAAQTETTRQYNLGQESSIENERQAMVSSLMSGARDNATKEIEARRKAKDEGYKSYVEYLKGAGERKATNTKNLVAQMVASGQDPRTLDTTNINEIAKGYGVTSKDIINEYNLQQYTKKQADEEARKALLAKKPETIETAQGIMQWNPATGKFEKTGFTKYEKPVAGDGGIGGVGTGGISPTAQNYINLIDTGTMTLDEALTKIGSTKASLGLKNEIIRGIAMKGGRTQQGIESLQDSKRIVDDLVTTGAEKALGGYSASIPGVGFFSQDYGDAKAKANQLSALLAKDNLGLLKGAMSDKDIAFIQAMSTGFEGQGTQSEAYVKSTLETIQKKLQTKLDKLGISEVPPANTPATPPVTANTPQPVTAPDGQQIIITD